MRTGPLFSSAQDTGRAMVMDQPQDQDKAQAVPVAARYPVPDGVALPSVLALGAFLKATVSLCVGREIWVSGDLGNLDSPQTSRQLEATARQMVADAGVRPQAVAHDLHPDFQSSRLAARLAAEWGVPAIAIQHHVAHMGALLVDHPLVAETLCAGTDEVFGLALDGFGLGPDRASWGGEMIALRGNGSWRRPGGLALLGQPGGDVAARQPWRMALAALHRLGRGGEGTVRFSSVAQVSPGGGAASVALIGQMLNKGLNSPLTSSCGRLFDAACGVVGVVPNASFEGEAPMAFERLVSGLDTLPHGWAIEDDGTLSVDPLLHALADMAGHRDCLSIPLDVQVQAANLFHGTLAAALVDWVAHSVPKTGAEAAPVLLGGGCFFNRVLSAAVAQGLAERGYVALLPRQLSPGDPAISTGQAWVAARLCVAQGQGIPASG